MGKTPGFPCQIWQTTWQSEYRCFLPNFPVFLKVRSQLIENGEDAGVG